MGSGLGRAAFRVSFYIAFTAGVLLLFLDRNTAEFSITLLTFLIGCAGILVVAVMVRFFSR